MLPLEGMDKKETAALATYMQSISQVPPERPKLLLVASAHWEEPTFTVSRCPMPEMLYDYSGFPPEAYKLNWPAPGAPELADAVYQTLKDYGFAPNFHRDRGHDHGTFIPLMLAYPNAEVPVVQVSLKRGLNAEEHLALGQALAPFRDQGAFILGSGSSYHNLKRFFAPSATAISESQAFDSWLSEAVESKMATRNDLLSEWQQAPASRACHPREEHLVPLMVAAGAAGEDLGRVGWRGTVNGLTVAAHYFG